jgi:Domain of unknown function (DUF397)
MDTPDLSQAVWRKSSRSSGNGQCVEWADLGAAVAVRDSKDPTGPALIFTPGEWAAFVEGVKAGEADQTRATTL